MAGEARAVPSGVDSIVPTVGEADGLAGVGSDVASGEAKTVQHGLVSIAGISCEATDGVDGSGLDTACREAGEGTGDGAEQGADGAAGDREERDPVAGKAEGAAGDGLEVGAVSGNVVFGHHMEQDTASGAGDGVEGGPVVTEAGSDAEEGPAAAVRVRVRTEKM